MLPCRDENIIDGIDPSAGINIRKRQFRMDNLMRLPHKINGHDRFI